MANSKLGELVARFQVEKGMSQNDLAEFLGVSTATINNWITGRRAPRLKMGPVFAKMGITADEFIAARGLPVAVEKKAVEANDDLPPEFEGNESGYLDTEADADDLS